VKGNTSKAFDPAKLVLIADFHTVSLGMTWKMCFGFSSVREVKRQALAQGNFFHQLLHLNPMVVSAVLVLLSIVSSFKRSHLHVQRTRV